jgi:hypothetical protein
VGLFYAWGNGNICRHRHPIYRDFLKSVRYLDLDQYFLIAIENKLNPVRIQNPLMQKSREVSSVPSSKVERILAPVNDAELCALLHGVQRGDVLHPQLKQFLVHLGYAEFRSLQLALTAKGRGLAETQPWGVLPKPL